MKALQPTMADYAALAMVISNPLQKHSSMNVPRGQLAVKVEVVKRPPLAGLTEPLGAYLGLYCILETLTYRNVRYRHEDIQNHGERQHTSAETKSMPNSSSRS